MKAEADSTALGNPCNIITQAWKSHYFAFIFSRKTNILHQQNLPFMGFSLDSPSGHAAMLPARYLQKAKTQSPRIHWESSFEADPKSGQIDDPESWILSTTNLLQDRNLDKKDLLWFTWEGSKGVLRIYKPLGHLWRVISKWNNEIWFILSTGIFKRLWQIHFLRRLSIQKGQGRC